MRNKSPYIKVNVLNHDGSVSTVSMTQNCLDRTREKNYRATNPNDIILLGVTGAKNDGLPF